MSKLFNVFFRNISNKFLADGVCSIFLLKNACYFAPFFRNYAYNQNVDFGTEIYLFFQSNLNLINKQKTHVLRMLHASPLGLKVLRDRHR